MYLSSFCLPVYQNCGLCVDGHCIPPDLAVQMRKAALQLCFCKMRVLVHVCVCALVLHQVPEPLCSSLSEYLPGHLYILLPILKYRYVYKQVYILCPSKRKERKGASLDNHLFNLSSLTV